MLGPSLYLGLGVLDAIAETTLILKLYRLPLWRYRYKVLLFAIGISIFSYFMRMVIGIPLFDLPLQYLLFIAFFRFGMNIKIHLASFIVGAGISLYSLIQLAIYYLGTYRGHWGSSILSLNDGVYVQIIQFSSDLVVIALAFIFKKFNLGFSFIKEPPHDFFLRENYLSHRNIIILASSCLSALTISATLILLYRSNVLGLTFLTIITFAISYYFSRRRDYEDVRTAIAAHRKKTKSNGP